MEGTRVSPDPPAARPRLATVLLGPLVWCYALVTILCVTDALRCLFDSNIHEYLPEMILLSRDLLLWGGLAGGLVGGLLAVPWLLGRPLALPIPVPLVVLASAMPAFQLVTGAVPMTRPDSGRPDVVLIVVDTLRKDFVDAEHAPHIMALAEDGVWFSEAYSTAPWTLPSFGSFLTGLHPHEHGMGYEGGKGYIDRPMRDDVPTLPEVLALHGYQTTALTASEVLGPSLGGMRGFEYAEDHMYQGTAWWALYDLFGGTPYPPGRLQATRAKGWLRWRVDASRPQFLLFHLMEPHTPHAPRSRWVRAEQQWSGEPADDLRVTYGAEVRQADAAIGALLDALAAARRYDDALIFVTSDHGEELDEGRIADSIWDPPYHGQSMFPELVRVPLVVKLPANAAAGTTCEGLRTLRDVPATVTAVLGLAPFPQPDGRPFLDGAGQCSAPRPHVYQSAIRLGPPQTAVRDPAHGVFQELKTGRLHAFDRVADPQFLAPLEQAPEPVAGVLHEYVDLQSAGPAHGPGDVVEMTEEQIEMLRQLGYIDD
jgi:arylsulfatase A-like enzyme